MTLALQRPVSQEIVYPDSDGQPMAENTLQFEWIVTIKENLEVLFRDRDDVFVAGDLLWYPVEFQNKVRAAPDAMVAFGRPKGYRGSYQQWLEGGVAPQVVFEILSPGNDPGEMVRKFYDLHGVEEYYLYDPERDLISGWLRRDGALAGVESLEGWVSPRLGVRFDTSGPVLTLHTPQGERFLTFTELADQGNIERIRADREQARAEHEQARADEAQSRADEAQARAERLLVQLRAAGIEPDA